MYRNHTKLAPCKRNLKEDFVVDVLHSMHAHLISCAHLSNLMGEWVSGQQGNGCAFFTVGYRRIFYTSHEDASLLHLVVSRCPVAHLPISQFMRTAGEVRAEAQRLNALSRRTALRGRRFIDSSVRLRAETLQKCPRVFGSVTQDADQGAKGVMWWKFP